MGTRGGGKVIVRPWLADPEVTLTEPWLKDNPDNKKVFTLAGFVPGRLTGDKDKVMDQKEQLRDIILRLGGELVESDEWDDRVTHVIAHVEGRKESMSEKVMAGLAGGRWVLTRRFLDKSQRRGSWADSPGLFAVSETVFRHRKAWHQHGPSGSVFSDMRAALLISDLRRAGVYKRVILSGGGKIFKCFSLKQLLAKLPTKQQLTHVFLDPWVLLPSDPRHQDFIRFRDYCQTHRLDIKFLYYKYLFMKIRQFPETPDFDYSIFNEKIQEMGLKEYKSQIESQRLSLKRPNDLISSEYGGRKKVRSEITEVTLDSSDEENEVKAGEPLSGVTDTSYVSQSLTRDQVPDNSCDTNSEVNVTDTSSVLSASAADSAHEVDVDVVEDSDEEEDDILVLEQKLALSWQEVGSGRRYLEREKAGAPGRNQVRSSEKRPAVYIPSQRDEYLRRTVETVETVTLDSESDQDDQPTICDTKKDKGQVCSARVLLPEGKEIQDSAPNIVIIESDNDDDVEVRERGLNLVSDQIIPDSEAQAGLEKGLEEAHIKVLALKDSVRKIEQSAPRIVRSQREEFLLARQEEEKALKLLAEVETESKIEDNLEDRNSGEGAGGKEEAETNVVAAQSVSDQPTSQETLKKDSGEEEDFSEDVIEFEDKFVDQFSPSELADFDDESDFEINTSNEEEKEKDFEINTKKVEEKDFSLDDVRLYATTAFQNYSSMQVNVRKLEHRVFLHHTKLMQEYMARKREAAAPRLGDTDDYFSSQQKILLNPLTPKKQSTSLLHRILSTLYKRFASTGELETVGFTSYHTPLQYDKNKESIAKTSDVSFIRPTLQSDYPLLIDDDTQDEEPDMFNQDEESNEDVDLADLNNFDDLKCIDSLTFLVRLKLETNSSRFPTSKMLNIVWRKCLLEDSCEQVKEAALDYLDHLLSFLSSHNRDVWLTAALSSLRELKDGKLFKTFDPSNPQELTLCFEFWKDICDGVSQYSQYSCNLWEDSKEDCKAYLGPYMVFRFLVKMMKKDLEIWGKCVESNLTSDVKFKHPLVFYILGGTKDLLKNFSKTVLFLFKQFLEIDHELTVVRQLVSIFSHCLSHLDLAEDYGWLYGGYKRNLARMICDVFCSVSLPATSLYLQLCLLSPSWLSAIVSHRLMARRSRQMEKVTAVSALRTKFLSLSQSQDITLLMVLDNFTHKLIGCQQVHSIFRAYWHYYKNTVNSDFLTFKQLSHLEETGPKETIVKFGSILFHLTSLTESVALLTEFSNGKLKFHLPTDASQGLDEIGALRALLFPMTGCNEF